MKHLENTTYLRHLQFASKTAGFMLVLGLVSLLHGIFPFLFPSYVSSHIHRLNTVFDDHVG